MKRIAKRLRPIAVALTLAAPNAFAQASPLPTTAQWREDLAYLSSAMKSVHPAPYHRRPEAEFDRAVRALDADLPRLRPEQIGVRLLGIVALLDDGHSRVIPAAPVFRMDRTFPVRFARFADGIYIVASRAERAELAGARVLSIGDRPAAAVWDSVSVVSSGDNIFSRWSTVPVMLSAPDFLAGLGLSSADSLIVSAVGADGKTIRATIPAVTSPFTMQWLKGWDGPGGSVATPLPRGSVPPLSERFRRSPYWYARDGTTLYAQINQVNDSRDSVSLDGERVALTLDAFGGRLMDRVEAGGVEKLVIDLRYNDGGNNGLAKLLVQRIAKSSINRRGKLFVVTGRETYSAAMNFTSLLEERTAAIFVGEPAGGSPAHYGDATTFQLPNSKLPVRISTLPWTLGVAPTDVREVMEPDLPAPPRFADYLAGRDGALATIAAYRDGAILTDRMIARFRAAGLDSAFALYDLERRALPAMEQSRSDVQQLLSFANMMIREAKTRPDIFRAFTFATERFPASHEAWTALGRVNAFVNDWPAVLRAYERARTLRPQNELIRRSHEVARRR